MVRSLIVFIDCFFVLVKFKSVDYIDMKFSRSLLCSFISLKCSFHYSRLVSYIRYVENRCYLKLRIKFGDKKKFILVGRGAFSDLIETIY